MSQAVSAAKDLEPAQRTRLGTGAMLVGVALIGVLGFATIPSTFLQVLLGAVGVLILVAGVLLVGTSDGSV